jgi:hypothetical protein
MYQNLSEKKSLKRLYKTHLSSIYVTKSWFGSRRILFFSACLELTTDLFRQSFNKICINGENALKIRFFYFLFTHFVYTQHCMYKVQINVSMFCTSVCTDSGWRLQVTTANQHHTLIHHQLAEHTHPPRKELSRWLPKAWGRQKISSGSPAVCRIRMKGPEPIERDVRKSSCKPESDCKHMLYRAATIGYRKTGSRVSYLRTGNLASSRSKTDIFRKMTLTKANVSFFCSQMLSTCWSSCFGTMELSPFSSFFRPNTRPRLSVSASYSLVISWYTFKYRTSQERGQKVHFHW